MTAWRNEPGPLSLVFVTTIHGEKVLVLVGVIVRVGVVDDVNVGLNNNVSVSVSVSESWSESSSVSASYTPVPPETPPRQSRAGCQRVDVDARRCGRLADRQKTRTINVC